MECIKEPKKGYVVLQVIRVYEIPITGIDEDDCIKKAYDLSTEEIEQIGKLENVELDYAEFRHWEEN